MLEKIGPAITEHLVTQFAKSGGAIHDRAQVTFLPPSDAHGLSVNLYLLHVQDDPATRDAGLAGFRMRGPGESPGIGLILTYLVTAHGSSEDEARILADVRRAVQVQPALTLDGQEVRLAIDPQPIPLNSALWVALQSRQRPCWHLQVRLAIPS